MPTKRTVTNAFCVMVLFCAFFPIVMPGEVSAQLKPENVAIITTAHDEESLRIARHYALARNLPPKNVYLLRQKYGEGIPRDVWEKDIRPPLKKWLHERPEIKCVICCWNVPLKIGQIEANSPIVEARVEFLTRKKKEYIRKCMVISAILNAVGTEDGKGQAVTFTEDQGLREISPRLDERMQAARGRMQLLSSERQAMELRRLNLAFQNFAGLQALLNMMKQQGNHPDAAAHADELKLKTTLLTLEIRCTLQTLASLESLPETSVRDAEILRLTERVMGVGGAMQWTDNQLEMIKQNESNASFDSELSVILREGHPLVRWISNDMSYHSLMTAANQKQAEEETAMAAEIDEADPLGLEAGGGKKLNAPKEEKTGRWTVVAPPKKPVLMVARLQAPKMEDVIRLIDDSIRAEKEGLQGAIYLDARCKRPDGVQPVGSYGKTEQSLCDLAIRLRQHTRLDVILDEEGGLLTPEKCPKPAALYAGWYSLGNYVHGCDWAPGSIGYHLASIEASSLRGGNTWCPQMLARGVAATLGPTDEPYLSAFPQPDEFFSLVLTGQFSMIECYYYTKAFNSWVMTYVGDPLYTPYKTNPQLDMSQLPGTLRPFFKRL